MGVNGLNHSYWEKVLSAKVNAAHSSRIWNRVTVSIFCANNSYAIFMLFKCHLYSHWCLYFHLLQFVVLINKPRAKMLQHWVICPFAKGGNFCQKRSVSSFLGFQASPTFVELYLLIDIYLHVYQWFSSPDILAGESQVSNSSNLSWIFTMRRINNTYQRWNRPVAYCYNSLWLCSFRKVR